MKSLLPLLLAAGLALELAGCGAPDRQTVFAIEKTRSYHRAACRRVFMARTAIMSVRDAVEHRYQACPLCKPDTEE